MLITFIVIAVIVVLLAVFVIGLYNSLVKLRNGYKNAFAQIDVQLTRRHDLIPNLVETAKTYMAHERATFEAIANARNAAISAQDVAKSNPGDPGAMGALGGAEGMLTQAMGKLFAVAEAYPDLKANQTMMQLSEELTTTENRVSFARQAFNDSVMHYNNKRETFPANMIAGPFGFTAAGLLEIENPEAREAPKVQF